MNAEDFRRRRDRLSKRKIRFSKEELKRRYEKYHGKTITCPLCGETGRLCFRVKGSENKRYFYCRHGDDACYIGRIEDIEELLNPPKETGKQATLV